MDKPRNLTDREEMVLGALVYEFISTGKPVGSRSFVQKYNFNLSPATMRNIMYDLELMGYLQQPHTSAGRIPTDYGYRFYVDTLIDSYELSNEYFNKIKEELITKELELDKMFASITRLLSDVSSYAGVVLTPRQDFTVVKHIELVPLGNNVVLFILVTRTGIVVNKRVTVSKTLNQDELHRFSKFLTTELNGFSLDDLKIKVITKLRNSMDPNNEMQLALDILEIAISDEQQQKIYLEGLENILKIPEMIDEELLLPFLHLFEEKNILSLILGQNIDTDGVSTMIGKEIEEERITGCSLVSSSYKIGNKHVGVVGIIGPTRMNYKMVVPLVDYTGKIVSELLTKMSR